jgi:hypothetical protein
VPGPHGPPEKDRLHGARTDWMRHRQHLRPAIARHPENLVPRLMQALAFRPLGLSPGRPEHLQSRTVAIPLRKQRNGAISDLAAKVKVECPIRQRL